MQQYNDKNISVVLKCAEIITSFSKVPIKETLYCKLTTRFYLKIISLPVLLFSAIK